MDKKTTRAFASGLFLSSLMLMGYQYFHGNIDASSTKKGYESVKVSEINKLRSDVGEWKHKYSQLQKVTANAVKKKETLGQTLVKYHLSITNGMTPDKIGNRLKTGGIIKDNQKFVQYLITHNYHNKIQIGEYELTTKMSFNEIAKVITKGK